MFPIIGVIGSLYFQTEDSLDDLFKKYLRIPRNKEREVKKNISKIPVIPKRNSIRSDPPTTMIINLMEMPAIFLFTSSRCLIKR